MLIFVFAAWVASCTVAVLMSIDAFFMYCCMATWVAFHVKAYSVLIVFSFALLYDIIDVNVIG